MPVALALEIFRVLAAATSLLMILSPVPAIFRIARAGVVGHHSIVPLVSLLANSHMNMLYGYMVYNIFPIFATFLVGDLLSVVYIAIFYRYTTDRAAAARTIVYFVVPLAMVTAYAAFGQVLFGQTRPQVGLTVGYLGIVSTLVLYGSPFEKIGQVLKHRSAVFLNIHMVVMGTFANSVWVTYTALENEWIVFSTSAFTVVAGLAQIALYVIYNPRTHPLPALEAQGDSGDSQFKKDDDEVEVPHTEFGMTHTPRSLSAFRLD